jgi:HEPN domain-containing protein
MNKEEPDYWSAAFHAHQCAEEALTGLLTLYDISTGTLESFEYLLELSIPVLPDLEKFREQVGKLTLYNTEPDNPAQYYDVTQKDASRAIDIARDIFESVSNFLRESS